MPNLANLTSKNGVGESVTLTGLIGQSGTAPAVFRDQAMGSSQLNRTELRVSVQEKATKVFYKETFVHPVLVTVDGIQKILGYVRGRLELDYDKSLPQTAVDDGVNRFFHVHSDPLVATAAKDGVALIS